MRDPTKVSAPDLKALTVLLASTATPERGGLPYLDAVLPAEHRLAATRVVRDLGALPGPCPARQPGAGVGGSMNPAAARSAQSLAISSTSVASTQAIPSGLWSGWKFSQERRT